MTDNRKEELLKKRQKLEELRRAREERIKSTPASKKEDFNQFLDDILSVKPKPTTEPTKDITPNITAPYINPPVVQSPSLVNPRYIPGFNTTETVLLDVPPRELVLYNKEVQTASTSFVPSPSSEDEIREQVKKEHAEKEKAKQLALEDERRREEEERERQLKLLERKIIVNSPEFMEFIDHTSRVVERAINESYDYIKEYTITNNSKDENNNHNNAGAKVKYLFSFFDEKWSKNRSVADVNWSHKNPELCVAAYNKNAFAANEPDGIVLVWNTHLVERPEFVFHSQSDVLTARFLDFNPSLIIGGTYSGQILIWDIRAKSLPVQKTPLGSVGHTHPVYSLQIAGTQNAHNLITASTDGMVCYWQLDSLNRPQEFLELVHSSNSKTDEVSVTALGFPANETAAFWVGTEEGNVYQANRYSHAGGKPGINPLDFYNGHWGPITGLDFHPVAGPIDFSDLFLTSSVDWTVKLWKSKSSPKASVGVRNISPLFSFEGADDYVYDVKWSPTHPALFGCVDGKGNFSLWNINSDIEVPILNTHCSNSALNKLQWDKEGRKVAIGSSDGRVHLYDIGEIGIPGDDDWTDMQKNVSELIGENEALPRKHIITK
nr:2192_t:CDS:10 [Entrophospora candida]